MGLLPLISQLLQALRLVASSAACSGVFFVFFFLVGRRQLYPRDADNVRARMRRGWEFGDGGAEDAMFKCSQVNLVAAAASRWKTALEWVASVALKWAPNETTAETLRPPLPLLPGALGWIWSPVNMRNVAAPLFGHKISHHSPRNIKNNPAAELPPLSRSCCSQLCSAVVFFDIY